MKQTDAQKQQPTSATRSNQPFFGTKSAQAFFAPAQTAQREPFFNPASASSSPPIQAKLTVGAAGDKYEQEADRVASEVVDRINSPSVQQGGDRPSLQRMGEEEDELKFKVTDTQSQVSNQTRLPETLKTSLEQLSGFDLSGIEVNYNSAKPAQLNAYAYTQGQTIEVGPGQEKYLPHEGWHVVQQMQGRVKPMAHAKGLPMNNSVDLENEADVMGGKAEQSCSDKALRSESLHIPAHSNVGSPIQLWQKNWKRGPEKRSAFTKQPGEKDEDFRLRMKSEMDSLREKLSKEDNSENGETFLVKQKEERAKELSLLREGKAEGGRIIEGKQGEVPTKHEYKQTSGAVTGGETGPAVSGSTDYRGGKGKKVKTLSGGRIGEIEDKLNHPKPGTRAATWNEGDEPLPRERLGMVDRQEQVMALAKDADPFMKTLETGGDLSQSHYKSGTTTPYTKKSVAPIPSRAKWDDVTMVHDRPSPADTPVYSYGAEEFKNKPTYGRRVDPAKASEPAGPLHHLTVTHPTEKTVVEQLLPELTNRPGGDAADGSGVTMRSGVWSEADLTPRERANTSTNKAKGRDARRLLYTDSTSKVKDPILPIKDPILPVQSEKPIDFQFWVTGDHYESAVPISPVEEKYQANHPYASPYMVGTEPGKNSLKVHEEKEKARIDREQAVGRAYEEAEKAASASSRSRDAKMEEEVRQREAMEAAEAKKELEDSKKELEDSKYGDKGL